MSYAMQLVICVDHDGPTSYPDGSNIFSWEQLVICVDPHGDQHHTPIFTIQVSVVDDEYEAITLEALNGGPERPKVSWN